MFILCNQQSICDQKYILFCFLIKSFLLNWIHTPWHFVNCAKVYLDHWKHPPPVLGDDHLVGEALELAPQAAVLQLDPGLLEAGVLGCGVGGGQAEAEVVRGHAAAAAGDTLHTGVSLHAPLSPLVPTCQLSRCHRWFRAEAAISAMSWEMFALGSPEINWGDSAAESAPRPALATRPQLRGSWPGAAALVAGSGYRAMVAAAAEAPEPEAGMGAGSGLAWPGRMWRWCWWRISSISGCTSPCGCQQSAGGTFTRLPITSEMPPPREREIRNTVCSGGTEPWQRLTQHTADTLSPSPQQTGRELGPCPEPSPQLRSPRLVSTWHPVPVTVVITSVVTRGRADLRPPSDLHCWHCLADHKTTDWLNQNCFTARNQNIYLGPGTDQKAIKNLNLRAGQSMWFGRSKGLNCIVQREKITYLRLILSSSGRWSKKVFILWQHFPRSWENIHWQ